MITDEKQVFRILWVFLIFGLIAGIYGIYCIKFGIGHSDRGVYRISSFFENPNTWGQVNTLLIPLAISLFIFYKSKIYKIFIFSIILLLLLGILASNSRMCFFALLPTVFFVVLKFYSGHNKIFAFVVTIFALLFTYYILPDSFKWKYMNRITNVMQSEEIAEVDSGRSTTFKVGFKIMLDNPIFGVGFTGYREKYAEMAISDPDIELFKGARTDEPLKPHNILSETGAFLGVIGLFLYLLLLLTAYKCAKNSQHRFELLGNQRMKVASIFMQSFLLCSFVLGQFTPFLTSKFFWMILPICARLETLSIQRYKEKYDG
ncbi:MAG TPA: O-antigen ligase domain-containing protein [Actinobacteria bacterium]|nr:O-antigen ligase domain-containing protein [Actinomycetota bacterium]